MNDNITNEQSATTSAEEKLILEKLCRAWNELDVSIIEPYLLPELLYTAFYNVYCDSKNEALDYLKWKFDKMSKSPEQRVNAEIVFENGKERVCIHHQDFDRILEISLQDGMIDKMLMRAPYSKFSVKKFKENFPEMLDMARRCLEEYFNGLNKDHNHAWCWISLTTAQKRYCDLCLWYEDHIFCIMIGLYEMKIDRIDTECFGVRQYDALITKCEKTKATPCMLFLDTTGCPVAPGCHLWDARSMQDFHPQWRSVRIN